ncbi:MAG: AbrB/MazE/SpoVT family DNA-binding domain-containing protein [Clostridia bacterium]|nr:AbrB/MazE/SpoVT family DNA-binding domain-containing protein [Clostridia bacterium]
MNFTVKRGVDKLGRIVIPKSMRDYYGIECGEDVVLVPTDDGLLIVKLTEREQKALEAARRAKTRNN